MKLGSVIAGRFRIERVIGRGAMGVVVEATDVTAGRRVAVKLILPQYARDAQLRGRFIREANAMTRLRSEHVARVYSAGELDDGMLFLAMEYLEGHSLEELIQSGPLPVMDAVELMLEALDAIGEAHDLGLVHRDLKPSNLFLAARAGGTPILKVLDFGIVKDTADQARLTAAGTLPGTPAYMSPEQIGLEEELIDARADIWAMGVTLHEILTGTLPFAGPIPEMLPRIRAEAPPRIRATRRDVAPELEALVERCLSKHPADRFASGRELAAALGALQMRGLARNDLAVERTAAMTAISAHRSERGAGATADVYLRQGGGRVRRIVTSLLVFGLVCGAAGALYAFRGRLVRPAVPTAVQVTSASAPQMPSVSAAVLLDPRPVSASASASVPATSSASFAVGVASGRRGAKHVRVLSAKNSGDRAWRAWIDRHRQRLDACAVQQACPVNVVLRLARSDAALVATVQPTPVARGVCGLHRSLVECLTELAREPLPAPDVCPDPNDCHAEVVLSFE